MIKENQKKMGRPLKFTKEQKEYLFNKSERKLTVINKVSTRNLALDFEKEFKISIGKSTVNNISWKIWESIQRSKCSDINRRSYKVKTCLLKWNYWKDIKSSDIVFTDECRVIFVSQSKPKN